MAAQGFGARFRPRGTVRPHHLRAVADRLGVVQIDSVNAVTRSHYLPFYSRLGPYDPTMLDALRDGPGGVGGRRIQRHLVEYWAHEASLIPIETWPLYGVRMRRAREEAWGNIQRIAADHPGLVDSVLQVVTDVGPMTSRETEAAMAHDDPRHRTHWGWNWSQVKTALEHLFWTGQLTSAGRTAQFERRYCAPEVLLPEHVLARGPYGRDPLPESEATQALVEYAARAFGLASEQCLRDYARISPERARPAIERLVERGVLVPAQVPTWRRPLLLHAEAATPARVRARALLSPFDSLIWQRDRTRALFDFDYRLEIYVPAPKRVHGYYVLPFLLGDRLVGRVDARSDRAAGVLRVHARHWESGRGDASDRAELDEELRSLADFLGLVDVEDAPGPVGP
nr:crosslink repair DNA glycosylase YcaQ family protein [Kineosphaera limosa]